MAALVFSLIEKLQRRLDDLTAMHASSGEALGGDAAVAWLSSRMAESEDELDLQQPGGLHVAFDRAEADDRIRSAYDDTPNAKTLDVLGWQAQSDFLAALERDISLRYRPRLRILAHEAARQTAYGMDDGMIASGPLAFFKSLIKRAVEY